MNIGTIRTILSLSILSSDLGFELWACEISAIDAPGGFLFEWWSVFWDIFIARTNEKHSEVAASYIEVGLIYIYCYMTWKFG